MFADFLELTGTWSVGQSFSFGYEGKVAHQHNIKSFKAGVSLGEIQNIKMQYFIQNWEAEVFKMTILALKMK